jgi:hypothetical protein
MFRIARETYSSFSPTLTRLRILNATSESSSLKPSTHHRHPPVLVESGLLPHAQ